MISTSLANLTQTNGIRDDPVNGELSTNCNNELLSNHHSDNNNNNIDKSSSISLTYCFVFGGNLQQWSESNDLICPWCQLNCHRSGSKGDTFLFL